MKKELKQISIIIIFLVIGCVMGYFVAAEQIKQLSNPEYIALLNSKGMSIPEPIGFTRSIISFGLLFSGIPTGIILYSYLSSKWLTSKAPKVLIGVIAFPIYGLIGAVCSIPFIIYKGICIFKKNE